MDQRLKNRSVHDWLWKRVVDQNWVDYEEEGDEAACYISNFVE